MRLLAAWILVAAAWACLFAAARGQEAALIGCVVLCGATYFLVWGLPIVQRQSHRRANTLRPIDPPSHSDRVHRRPNR
jgi:hypothetical protein